MLFIDEHLAVKKVDFNEHLEMLSLLQFVTKATNDEAALEAEDDAAKPE